MELSDQMETGKNSAGWLSYYQCFWTDVTRTSDYRTYNSCFLLALCAALDAEIISRELQTHLISVSLG